MEYLEHGDLQNYIGTPFPEPQAASIVAQVARALQYMHHRQFVHRDVKPKVGVPFELALRGLYLPEPRTF